VALLAALERALAHRRFRAADVRAILAAGAGDDEAELDGLHIVVGDFDRRRLGYSAAIVVDGIRFLLTCEP
jgi:hypothetical protein